MSTFDMKRVRRQALTDRVRTYVATQTSQLTCSMAALERLAVTESLTLGLTDLGYSLTSAAGEYTSAIEASRGHEKVLVIVRDGGEVTTDWIGLRDHRCVDRQAEIEGAAARYGLEFEEGKASLHHDHRGGQTVAAAARQHGRTLAEGAILYAEAGVETNQLYTKAPAQRERVRGW